MVITKFDSIKLIIQKAAEAAGMHSGVYKMINSDRKVIYVGKAKYLKNRLMSYTHFDKLANRTKMMVSNIADIETVIVNTDTEALLLESNLIKQLKPFYNILLRDDKTFPYIVIDYNSEFPRIFKHRTTKASGANFFGPYPVISSLDETLKIVHRAFMLRGCTDNYFSSRDRPCLQYFIKRCSAPCMNKISREEYSKNVELAKNLLLGKDEVVRRTLVDDMNRYSKLLDFEKASIARDSIKALSGIQTKQYVQISNLEPMDFIAVAMGGEKSVVIVSFFRIGKNVGSEKFVIQNSSAIDTPSDILETFIVQFYKNVSLPDTIVVSHNIKNKAAILGFLNQTKIIVGKKGDYGKVIDSCLMNASIVLNKEKTNEFKGQIERLQKLLGADKINRIEAYDNSHIQGTNACGVMIVFEDGEIKKDKARKFNIDAKTANGGDDIQMMQFILQKRFSSKSIVELPCAVLIDGGKIQTAAAQNIIRNFDPGIKVFGVAKQNFRKIGEEKIVLTTGEEVILGRDDELLSFLIMLRNEAHKTAITFHRKKMKKSVAKSILEEIPTVGKVRRKKLLEHFGSVELIKKASVYDLKMVKGVDDRTSLIIYNFFRKDQSR
jgi:excinuclease ABC subunit C